MRKTTTRLLLLVLLCMGGMFAFGQTRTISGTVLDEAGNPIAGASVSVKGGKTLAATNGNGQFTITLSGTAKSLVFSSIGFTTFQLDGPASSPIVVTMKSAAAEGGEVVVTGFGVKKDVRKLSYSVSAVSGEELTKSNTPNPINALQGKVPGLYMSGVAGGPQTSSRILLRGISDITPGGNNQPLFVIDGILIQPGVTNTGDVYGSDQDFGNQLKNIDADDIESISVLKGSAGTALYGSAAQNGVILITTKKGGKRKGLGISVTQQYSNETPYGGANFQNGWGAGENPAYFDSHNLTPTGTPTIDNGSNGAATGLVSFGHPFDGTTVKTLNGRVVPWVAQPHNYLDVYRTGSTYNSNISIDGGSENTTFHFSWSDMTSKGITPTNDFSRNNFFLRATQKIGNVIDIDANVNYAISNVNNPESQNSSSRSIFNGFVYSATRDYDAKYELAHLTDSVKGGFNITESNTYANAGNGYSLGWFLYKNYYWKTSQLENNLRANVDITFHFTPWLKLLTRMNMLNSYTTYEQKYYGSGPGFLGQVGLSDDFSDKYQVDRKTFTSYRGQALLTASKALSKNFEGSFTVGGEIYNYGNAGELVNIQGLKVPGVFNLSNYANYSNTSFSSDAGNNYRNVSFYAFGDLGYKDQLYLNFSERAEYSSSLVFPNGTGNNSYQYPSVGLGWILSKTFKLPYYVSFAKLRASYAQTGKDILPWQIASDFRTYSYTGTSTTTGLPLYGFSTTQIVDPSIKPQRTNEEEVGLNLQFFKNRIGIDVAAFQKTTSEQISNKALAIESGASGLLLNNGTIRNRGLEIQLTATPVRTKNFSWNTIINYTKYVNKILSYASTSPYVSLESNLRSEVRAYVGAAYGELYSINAFTPYQAYDASGNKTADANNGKHTIFNSGGYWRYLPSGGGYVNGSYYTNQANRIGNINPKFLWSWNNQFNYKNFFVSFFLDARVGGQLQSFTYKFGTGNGDFISSIPGRDAAHGGVAYNGKDANGVTGNWNDGVIIDGVFEQGMTASVNGTTVQLGGMTFKDAVTKGYVSPVPAAQYYAQNYGSWSRGIADMSTFDDTWISVREVNVGYNLPQSVLKKAKINSARVSLVGRNLFYLYNSFGGSTHINPEGIYNNSAAAGFEFGAGPSTRSVGVSLNANF